MESRNPPPLPAGVSWSGTAPVPLTPSGSPYTIQNVTQRLMNILVSGGTVTLVEFSRDGSTWFGMGLLAGQFELDPADSLRITYILAPTVTAVLI